MKGLVQLRKALPKKNPLIPEGPVRDPVNKQAALIVAKAPWIYKPLPSDPDLSDRKTVLEFLKERSLMKDEISRLRSASEVMRKEVKRMEGEVKDLKTRLNQLKDAGKTSVTVEIKPQFSEFTDDELKAAVFALREARERNVDSKHFDLKGEMQMRDFQEKIEKVLQERIAFGEGL